MACGELTQVVQRRLYANTATIRYEGYSSFVPISDLGRIKAVIRRSAASGNLQWAFAWQFAATRTDEPGPWYDTGSFSTSDGTCTGEITTISAAGKMFVRFGIAYKSSSEGQACVDLQVSYDNPGSVVGAKTLVARATGTASSFERLSTWLPVLRATNVKVAMVVSPQSGSYLKLRPTYQLATVEVTSPNAWVTNWGDELTAGANTVEYTSQNLSLTNPGGAMWVRFGLQSWLSQAGQAQADVSMMVMVWC